MYVYICIYEISIVCTCVGDNGLLNIVILLAKDVSQIILHGCNRNC